MKEYALRIESEDQGLIFHFLMSKEEAENTKIWIGSVELISKMDNKEAHHINAKSIPFLELYKVSCVEDEGGFELI